MEKVAIKRALISVSDKTGLESLLETLQAFNVALVSTGGRIKRSRQPAMTSRKFRLHTISRNDGWTS